MKLIKLTEKHGFSQDFPMNLIYGYSDVTCSHAIVIGFWLAIAKKDDKQATMTLIECQQDPTEKYSVGVIYPECVGNDGKYSSKGCGKFPKLGDQLEIRSQNREHLWPNDRNQIQKKRLIPDHCYVAYDDQSDPIYTLDNDYQAIRKHGYPYIVLNVRVDRDS